MTVTNIERLTLLNAIDTKVAQKIMAQKWKALKRLAKKQRSKETGYILWEGPSAYDGAPIVVIGTLKSTNPKTGNMVQVWIMRQDIAPNVAIKTGADTSVCGQCPLRPLAYKGHGLKKPCYVLTHHAPLAVWCKYRRGGYQHMALPEFRQLLQGKAVRLGAYGDPASVPFEVWESLGVGTGEFTHTSYTHGYLLEGFDIRHLSISMVSLDQVTQQTPPALTARTFRVINAVDQLQADEILCPASKEGGFKTTCAQCGLCAGLNRKAKNIAIVAH